MEEETGKQESSGCGSRRNRTLPADPHTAEVPARPDLAGMGALHPRGDRPVGDGDAASGRFRAFRSDRAGRRERRAATEPEELLPAGGPGSERRGLARILINCLIL